MPWRRENFKPLMFIAPSEWEQDERYLSPEEKGVQHAVIIKVHSNEVNKRQLDPRVVNLDSLLEQGITIDPGSVRSMLNLTDPAQIEEYNSQYCEQAYHYLTEHKDEIFKSDV